MSAVETSTEVMDADHCPDDEPALTPPGHAAADPTSAGEDSTVTGSDSSRPRRHRSWASFFGYRVRPRSCCFSAFGAGHLKYGDSSARGADLARINPLKQRRKCRRDAFVHTGHRPSHVDGGPTAPHRAFRDSYAALTHDVVIPGAIQKQVSATATVPAAASVGDRQPRGRLGVRQPGDRRRGGRTERHRLPRSRSPSTRSENAG